MFARMPRRLLGFYVHAVRQVQAKPGREGDYGGWIPARSETDLLDEATRRLVFWLWHPILGWIAMHFTVGRENAKHVRSYDWANDEPDEPTFPGLAQGGGGPGTDPG
jgi:hypothetical protein